MSYAGSHRAAALGAGSPASPRLPPQDDTWREGLGGGARAEAGGFRDKSMREEIRGIVREELVPLDRRLLALEKVSDTNAVVVQQLREQLLQTVSSSTQELAARLNAQLADATAASQSALARAVEQLEAQLADHVDRLNAVDWAMQRQDVALARSVDRIVADLSRATAAGENQVVVGASPSVSAQQGGGGLSLRFDGAASPGYGPLRIASAALQETRFAQAQGGLPLDRSPPRLAAWSEVGSFSAGAAPGSPHHSLTPRGSGAGLTGYTGGGTAGSPRRNLRAYLFDEASSSGWLPPRTPAAFEPDGTPLMGLIARDAAGAISLHFHSILPSISL